MAAVSTISTMKVDRPRARSSAAPTRLNSRSTTPIWACVGRHEGAHLRQHHDQGILAQEGRFAGHVGTGEQPDAAAVAGEIAVIGDEGGLGACRCSACFDHRMAAVLDRKRVESSTCGRT